MFRVEKYDSNKPMIAGIGTKAQERALYRAGCEKVFQPRDLAYFLDEKGVDADLIFRADDTIIMVQPGLLKPEKYRTIAAIGMDWQVIGHDPVKLKTEDDRKAFRGLKAKGVRAKIEREHMGRPPKHPIPTTGQVAAILAVWHGGKKPGPLTEQVQRIMGAEVPYHWIRDQVIKAKGNARRSED